LPLIERNKCYIYHLRGNNLLKPSFPLVVGAHHLFDPTPQSKKGAMKSAIAILLLGIYLHTASARLPHVGCAGKDDSLTTHLLASIPVIGRKLLANWMPCGEERNTKLKGKPLDKFESFKDFRACCVKCKQVKNCIAWSYNSKKRNCKVFADSDDLEKTDGVGYTAGILQWRL
jgi:PAN domain